MTEVEFDKIYSDTLMRIEDAIEASGADLDYETVNDILTIGCPDGSVIIVTRQTAARQLWVAARAGGFHFDYDEDGGQWLRSPGGESLEAVLGRIGREQAGAELEI